MLRTIYSVCPSIARHTALPLRYAGAASTLSYLPPRILSVPACRRTLLTSSSDKKNTSNSSAAQKHALERRNITSPSSTKGPPGSSELTKQSAATTIPTMVRGDWVLFHPVYTTGEVKAVKVLHRERRSFSDSVAYGLVKLARVIFDKVSGYKHMKTPPDPNMSIYELRKAGYLLDDKAWLSRILFLESIAGVPGMVAATLRHLTSLRLLCRDGGWIHTCLEEAENERMHLMTFMALKNPSLFFRALVLGAQGVFYNLFFVSYLISPRICHRFVGYLEEEAVYTYTHCIADLEAGRIPEWSDMPAPQIAIDYWRLPKDAKLLDVIYAVRSDETTHRFVNHSFANLNPKTDVNPFALREPDMHVKGGKIEFERQESEDYARGTHEMMEERREATKKSENPTS